MLKWIWSNQFAAVAGDMIAFEALPFQSKEYWLHEWLLAGWGLPIGELFDLEALTAECRKLGKWSFFFSSVPLKVCVLLNSKSIDSADNFRFLEGWRAHRMVSLFCDEKNPDREY